MAKNHRIVALLLVAATLVAQLAPASACAYCSTPSSPPPPSPSPPPPTPVPCPPPPSSTTPPAMRKKCPVDTLKLLACVDVLGGGLVHAVIGAEANQKCCPLLSGVADLDAALCLCTTIKAKALDVSLVLPIALQVLVKECHKDVPANFQCPY